MTQHLLYTKTQVADLLAISLSTVDRLIRAGELRAIYIGDLVRVSENELNRLACRKSRMATV